MKNHFALLCALVLLLSSRSATAQQELFHRVKAKATRAQLKQLQKAELLPDHFTFRDGIFLAEMPESTIKLLEEQGLKFDYEIRDVARNISIINKSIDSVNNFNTITVNGIRRMGTTTIASVPTNFSYGSMGGFYTYTEAVAVLDEMRTKFPNLVSAKETIGTTYEGRPIYAVRISDNPDTDESNEDEWEVTSLHHANEVMGMSVAYYYIWHLLENYSTNPEYRYLLDNSELYLVPVINPDGLAFNESTNPSGGGTWRKNRKPRTISGTTHYGVDLNRNYGFKWAYNSVGQSGSNFAGNNYYRGTAAWSEFETQAMRSFATAHEFVAAINFHAWDDSFNYPWNYETDLLPSNPDGDLMQKIAGQYVIDNGFEVGHFNNTLGYTANGTSDDWLYGEEVSKAKIYAFTIEIGRSTFWPASSEIAKYGDTLLKSNVDMLRMINKYLDFTDISGNSIALLNTKPKFTLKRYSIQDATYTVSIIPISSQIVSVGSPKTFSAITFLDAVEDSIAIELNASTPNGTLIEYVVRVDNGAWSTYDTIVKTYTTSSLPYGCDDHFEPNNTIRQATALFEGNSLNAAIQIKGDKDWYSFETNEHNTNVRVALTRLPADYDVRLYSDDGKLLAQSSAKGKTNDTLVFNTGKKGSYRIEVFGYKDAYSSQRCYSIAVELSDKAYAASSSMNGKEPDVTMKVQVFPSPAQERLYVNIESSVSYKGEWTIYNSKGQRLKSGSLNVQQGSTLHDIELTGASPGTYYFVLMRDRKIQFNKKIMIK